jgi:hypothetical protein
VTPHQPYRNEVIELLDDSQPGSDDSSPLPPDSAAAALRSTPQSQRRCTKRPAAAAAEASAAGGGVAGLRTVLDQFRFSQEGNNSQEQEGDRAASIIRQSQHQLSSQPLQKQQQGRRGTSGRRPAKHLQARSGRLGISASSRQV